MANPSTAAPAAPLPLTTGRDDSTEALVVHHLKNSRVLFVLEEELVHPLGKSPVVEVGSGLVLAETGAVIDFLLERYDTNHALSPPPTAAAADPAGLDPMSYRFWFQFADASL
ncbi:hypothetical protein HK405_004468 [Cladochytrium tenue]|nr:hypothetical protein HK405_004468 [Cladochytrium tenue]